MTDRRALGERLEQIKPCLMTHATANVLMHIRTIDDVLALLREEADALAISLSIQDDPLAITELLRDGNEERERLHALLLEIMRAIPDGNMIPQDAWPDAIRELVKRAAPAERTETPALPTCSHCGKKADRCHHCGYMLPSPPAGDET